LALLLQQGILVALFAHGQMNELLLLCKLFAQELPPISVIKEVVLPSHLKVQCRSLKLQLLGFLLINAFLGIDLFS